jgi:hypothetical protein
MLVPGPSTVPAGRDASRPTAGEGLAARLAAGPGLWEEQPSGLGRDGLIGQLLADGVIAEAVAGTGHGHRLHRALNAETTALSVVTGALSLSGLYMMLAKVFAMPGLR